MSFTMVPWAFLSSGVEGQDLRREQLRWGEGIMQQRNWDTVPEERRKNKRGWAEVCGADIGSMTWGLWVLVTEMGGWPRAQGNLWCQAGTLRRGPGLRAGLGREMPSSVVGRLKSLLGGGVKRRSWLCGDE